MNDFYGNYIVSIPSLQLLPNRFIGHPGLAEMDEGSRCPCVGCSARLGDGQMGFDIESPYT